MGSAVPGSPHPIGSQREIIRLTTRNEMLRVAIPILWEFGTQLKVEPHFVRGRGASRTQHARLFDEFERTVLGQTAASREAGSPEKDGHSEPAATLWSGGKCVQATLDFEVLLLEFLLQTLVFIVKTNHFGPHGLEFLLQLGRV